MCGIYFCLGECKETLTKHACLESRGPDRMNVVHTEDYFAAFHRLAIVGVSDGMQPFQDGDLTLLCNGEIYNYDAIKKLYDLPVKSSSDCECILHMYRAVGIEATVRALDGEFAFVLYDSTKKIMHFARDILGRKPLYYSVDADTKKIDVCSLYAGLEFENKQQVVPRYLYTYDAETAVLSKQVYHSFIYTQKDNNILDLYDAFRTAVYKRVHQSERPVGFLLSGGFDSSLVLSVALAHANLTQPPHVFTIGFAEDAPDIKSAELMVAWLRKQYGENCIKWHRIIMPLQSGLDAIPDVIQALETYDTTTIRASTPMYLISKYIAENTDVKVLLSGEGSDELFGGYLYFKYAPNDQAFRAEIIDRLNELYLYDVLRADRTTAAWGLEVRPPFLDDDFVNAVLNCKELKKCKGNTKELIRDVVSKEGLLPDEILYGKKEAFSDAVGMTWKDAIQHHANEFVAKLPEVEKSFEGYSPHIPPVTAEMMYFQYLFRERFISKPSDSKDAYQLLPHLWLPNQHWIKTGIEPSARILPNY